MGLFEEEKGQILVAREHLVAVLLAEEATAVGERIECAFRHAAANARDPGQAFDHGALADDNAGGIDDWAAAGRFAQESSHEAISKMANGRDFELAGALDDELSAAFGEEARGVEIAAPTSKLRGR